jgi:hypothetical protein
VYKSLKTEKLWYGVGFALQEMMVMQLIPGISPGRKENRQVTLAE